MTKIKRSSSAEVVHLGASQGYRWIDKDPVIDQLLYLCKLDGRSLSAIARAAWLSPTTLHNWDRGKTRKPNNVSVEFTLRALGYERRLVKTSEPKEVLRWRKG